MHSNFSEKIVLFFMGCVMNFAALEILDSMGINECSGTHKTILFR